MSEPAKVLFVGVLTHDPHPDSPYLDRSGIAVRCPYWKDRPKMTTNSRIGEVNGVLSWIIEERMPQ